MRLSKIKPNKIAHIKGDKEIKKVLDNPELILEYKIQILSKHVSLVSKIKNKKVYLSKVDLENDLYLLIPNEINELFESVEEMQKSKQVNIIRLCEKLNYQQTKLIFNDENFECLKEFIK